jgi:WD40 repeat protein/serine/threonine protein kinase
MKESEERPVRSDRIHAVDPRTDESVHYEQSAARLEDQRVTEALEEYLAALEAGQTPDREDFLTRYAPFAGVLAECLDGLRFVHAVTPRMLRGRKSERTACVDAEEQTRLANPLGDFQILREIGRGGMGVVYEALQLSLGRRVALKVLPFAAALDAKQLQRFRNEAQAAAHLHHTNIVPVFGVGCERGVHYYAMQFIEGQTLAAIIRELRENAQCPMTNDQRMPNAQCPSSKDPLSDANAQTNIRHSTLGILWSLGIGHSSFFRTVAHLGVQAAEGLEHAHQLGVIHRDIKPANLLVDTGGRLWITDFGLAHCQSQPGLTMTGDVLGTLRYMSPEQALAKRATLDARTDVYSLGVTLYELLTLEPAYNGRDREEVLRQIAFEEPRLPSRWNQAVPAELETIVLKAMAKTPEERYATAQELADDLQRYMKDEPIRARRPTVLHRVKKWTRRHLPVVWTAGLSLVVMLLLAVIGLAVSNILIAREKAQTDAANRKLERTLYYQRVARAEREWSGTVLTQVDQLLDDCPAHLRGWEWHYVKRLRLQGLSPLRHPTSVFSAVFSPDGRWIASGNGDGKLRVWDAATGHRLAAIQAHEPPIHCVAFSPDGQRLATASFDGTAKVWSFDPQGAPDKHIQLPISLDHKSKKTVLSVAFRPDGQHLASAGDDETVHVWEVATGREVLPPLPGHTGRIWGVAYSPDGQCLASASADTTVKLWDASTGREKFTFTGHSGQVLCVTFSSDGRLVASSTRQINTRDDCEFKVWDAQTGDEILTQGENIGAIKAVTFSPHADSHPRLASCGFDGKVKIWDLATGQEALSLGEGGGVQSVAFSRDGNRLVSASIDGYVRVWDARPLEGGERQEVATLLGHDGGVHGVVFSPDGRHLVSAGADDTVRLWDFQRALRREAHPLIHTWPVPNTERYCAYNVAFSANGQLLTAGGEDGPQGGWLKVWDTTTWNKVRPFFNGCGPVAFSPDDRYFVAAVAQVGMPLPIKVCDAATGREIQTLKGRDWSVHDMAFAPKADPPLLATASSNGTRIWDVMSGEAIKTLDTGWARCVAFSPNGELVALAAVDRVIQMWDTRSWKKLAYEPSDTPGCIYSLVFHPKESQVLAWGSTAGKVRVCDSATKEIRTLHGHTSGVLGVAFSPDGKWIASASLDGTVKIWETPSLADSTGIGER